MSNNLTCIEINDNGLCCTSQVLGRNNMCRLHMLKTLFECECEANKPPPLHEGAPVPNEVDPPQNEPQPPHEEAPAPDEVEPPQSERAVPDDRRVHDDGKDPTLELRRLGCPAALLQYCLSHQRLDFGAGCDLYGWLPKDLSRSAYSQMVYELIELAVLHNPNLVFLNLRECALDRRKFRKLMPLLNTHRGITTLDLSGWNKIDAGALTELLQVNTTLQHLSFAYNKVGGRDGAEEVAQALVGNTTLMTLDLTCTGMTSAGGRAFAEVLKRNTTLTTLSLASNNIQKTTAQALRSVLREHNTTLLWLDLRENDMRLPPDEWCPVNKKLWIYQGVNGLIPPDIFTEIVDELEV